jgi:hypothetical protein
MIHAGGLMLTDFELRSKVDQILDRLWLLPRLVLS